MTVHEKCKSVVILPLVKSRADLKGCEKHQDGHIGGRIVPPRPRPCRLCFMVGVIMAAYVWGHKNTYSMDLKVAMCWHYVLENA